VTAFVGRTDELQTIADLSTAVTEGAVVAVVVTGDPGSGKTRLLAEAADRLGFDPTLRVVGYEPEARIPLAAASSMLRSLAAVHGVGASLQRLVFERDDAATLEPMRVFETVHRALDAVEPALIVIDDVQWVDDLSLALCHYVARAAETTGQRLMLLAAARPSAQAASLADSLLHVLPRERCTTLRIGPLSMEISRALVLELRPELDAETADDIALRSGGSPFWLEALVRTREARDAAQLVTARLRGAGVDVAELVALLAVGARPLALADVAQLQGWSAERVEYAAAALAARGIAIESPAGLSLGHDLIRAAALEDVPGEKRREVHRRLAEWLEGIAGDDVRRLREALDHRHAAGLSSVELATRLARARQRTLLGAKGLELLAAVADEGEASDRRVVGLNEAIAVLAGELAEYPVALARWRSVASQSGDRLQRARAFLRSARAALALDDAALAHDCLARAREERVADELFQLELETQEVTVGLWSGEERAPARATAEHVVQRARSLLGSVDALDPRGRHAYLEALRVASELAFQNDDVEAQLRAAQERSAVARGFDSEAHLAATIAAGRTLRRVGRLVEAEQRLRDAWEEARRLVLPQATIDAGYWLASVLEQRGRILEAEEVVTEADALAARAGDEALGRHRIDRLRPKIAFHRGDWRAALTALREHSRDVSTHGRIELYQDGALWLALVGGEELGDESLSWLEDARACAERAACPRCGAELRLVGAEVLVRTGRVDQATASLREWQELQRRPQPRDEIVQRRVEALIRLGAGSGDGMALERTAADAEERGFRLEALWTRIDLGRVLARDDRDRSVAVLREAAEDAARAGAITEEQVAQRALRSLGVRTWRRTSSGEPLTEREQEIVRLISEGASNPVIAERLFLSRKTVERHVSNVLKKVGARNRAELAAKAAELKAEGAPR
jgi:DNA-binding CsgD family transcriptional regulator